MPKIKKDESVFVMDSNKFDQLGKVGNVDWYGASTIMAWLRLNNNERFPNRVVVARGFVGSLDLTVSTFHLADEACAYAEQLGKANGLDVLHDILIQGGEIVPNQTGKFKRLLDDDTILVSMIDRGYGVTMGDVQYLSSEAISSESFQQIEEVIWEIRNSKRSFSHETKRDIILTTFYQGAVSNEVHEVDDYYINRLSALMEKNQQPEKYFNVLTIASERFYQHNVRLFKPRNDDQNFVLKILDGDDSEALHCLLPYDQWFDMIMGLRMNVPKESKGLKRFTINTETAEFCFAHNEATLNEALRFIDSLGGMRDTRNANRFDKEYALFFNEEQGYYDVDVSNGWGNATSQIGYLVEDRMNFDEADTYITATVKYKHLDLPLVQRFYLDSGDYYGALSRLNGLVQSGKASTYYDVDMSKYSPTYSPLLAFEHYLILDDSRKQFGVWGTSETESWARTEEDELKIYEAINHELVRETGNYEVELYQCFYGRTVKTSYSTSISSLVRAKRILREAQGDTLPTDYRLGSHLLESEELGKRGKSSEFKYNLHNFDMICLTFTDYDHKQIAFTTMKRFEYINKIFSGLGFDSYREEMPSLSKVTLSTKYGKESRYMTHFNVRKMLDMVKECGTEVEESDIGPSQAIGEIGKLISERLVEGIESVLIKETPKPEPTTTVVHTLFSGECAAFDIPISDYESMIVGKPFASDDEESQDELLYKVISNMLQGKPFRIDPLPDGGYEYESMTSDESGNVLVRVYEQVNKTLDSVKLYALIEC